MIIPSHTVSLLDDWMDIDDTIHTVHVEEGPFTDKDMYRIWEGSGYHETITFQGRHVAFVRYIGGGCSCLYNDHILRIY